MSRIRLFLSARAGAQTMMSIALDDADAEIDPIPVATDVGIAVPEVDLISSILTQFHDLLGNIERTDEDRVCRQISELPDIVSQDPVYQNAMRNSDAQNARDESDRATMAANFGTMSAGIELYKHINGNTSLKKWILDMVFNTTYSPSGLPEQKKLELPGTGLFGLSEDDMSDIRPPAGPQ